MLYEFFNALRESHSRTSICVDRCAREVASTKTYGGFLSTIDSSQVQYLVIDALRTHTVVLDPCPVPSDLRLQVSIQPTIQLYQLVVIFLNSSLVGISYLIPETSVAPSV